MTTTVPVSFPAAFGLKITPNIMLWPAFKETGALAPLRANPAPLSAICEIVTLELPALVTVTFCVDDDPAFTLPKPRFDALKLRDWVAAIPVPVRLISAGEFGALLTTVTLPLVEPADVGANSTLKVVDWPEIKVTGSASVPVLKPLPATLN